MPSRLHRTAPVASRPERFLSRPQGALSAAHGPPSGARRALSLSGPPALLYLQCPWPGALAGGVSVEGNLEIAGAVAPGAAYLALALAAAALVSDAPGDRADGERTSGARAGVPEAPKEGENI